VAGSIRFRGHHSGIPGPAWPISAGSTARPSGCIREVLVATRGAGSTNGSVVSDGDGSRLTGTLGPSVGLLMFSVVWVGLVVAFAAVGLVGLIHGLLAGDAVLTRLLLSLGPFVMRAFFVVMFEHRLEIRLTRVGVHWRNG